MKKNLLFISHDNGLGGGERVLLDFVSLVDSLKYEILVVVPPGQDKLDKELNRNYVKTIRIGNVWSTPSTHIGLYYTDKLLPAYQEILKNKKIDLIISNTIASVVGLKLSSETGTPHMTICSENLEQDIDLMPTIISSRNYLDLFDQYHQVIVCASRYTSKQFLKANTYVIHQTTDQVLPLDEPNGGIFTQRVERQENIYSIVWIGVQNSRKNPVLAYDICRNVMKWLAPSQVSIELHLFGNTGTQTTELRHRINSFVETQNLIVNDHGYQNDVFENLPANPILLITATTEPFGLNGIEAMSRGIPTVSKRCGGPEDYLTEGFLFTDQSEAEEVLISVIEDYEAAVEKTRDGFRHFYPMLERKHRIPELESAITSALISPSPLWSKFFDFGRSCSRLEDHISANLPRGEKQFSDNNDQSQFSRLSRLTFILYFLTRYISLNRCDILIIGEHDNTDVPAVFREVSIQAKRVLREVGPGAQIGIYYFTLDEFSRFANIRIDLGNPTVFFIAEVMNELPSLNGLIKNIESYKFDFLILNSRFRFSDFMMSYLPNYEVVASNRHSAFDPVIFKLLPA